MSQNYVIQLLLEHGTARDRAIFISKLRGQLLQMARHKYASNVCEKALVTADPESRRLLLDEIMFTRQDGVSHLLIMMKDQYASKFPLLSMRLAITHHVGVQIMCSSGP